MSCTHIHMSFIQNGGNIMGMDSVYGKIQDSIMFFWILASNNMQMRYFLHFLHCQCCQGIFLFLYCIKSNGFYIVDGCL